MPRPSLKDQRSLEILDAFVTCAARYGVEGATQERIASEAGVKRTLLRHYLGNRDDMIDALCAHVVEEFDALTVELGRALDEATQPAKLIELLFDSARNTDPRLVLVFQALIATSETRTDMRKPLLSSMERFIALITSFLRQNFSGRRKPEYEAIAHGIAALYMTCDAFSPLDPPHQWRTATKRAAIHLIKTLEAA